MDCMVFGEKKKLGELSSPAPMGDGSTGAAGRCPSVSSRGSPPSLPAGAYVMDDVAAAGAGLPVSRCTTLMNSCGLAWTTFSVFLYTITGATPAFLELDGFDAGDDEDTFGGCGHGPRRPLLEGHDDASEDRHMATVMVMLVSYKLLVATQGALETQRKKRERETGQRGSICVSFNEENNPF
jgi:hypothetical protein